MKDFKVYYIELSSVGKRFFSINPMIDVRLYIKRNFLENSCLVYYFAPNQFKFGLEEEPTILNCVFCPLFCGGCL